MGGKMIEVKCQRCKQPFMAREADRKRGWGRFCSKSCKAVKQVQTKGDTRMYAPGVTRARAAEDQRRYGGYPQYDRHGEYVGFTMSPECLAAAGYNNADWDDPIGGDKS